MNGIDLQAIIDIHMADTNVIAELLFPENKFPRLALNRILQGDAKLESDQIERLANYLNVKVDDLYNERWKKMSISKNIVSFTHGEFTAKLHLDTMVTRVFHNKTLMHDSVLHKSSITLKEYFKHLDQIVTNYTKDGIKN